MNVLEQLFNYFMKYPDRLPPEYARHISDYGKEQAVCDYIAGMTDDMLLDSFMNCLCRPPETNLKSLNIQEYCDYVE